MHTPVGLAARMNMAAEKALILDQPSAFAAHVNWQGSKLLPHTTTPVSLREQVGLFGQGYNKWINPVLVKLPLPLPKQTIPASAPPVLVYVEKCVWSS